MLLRSSRGDALVLLATFLLTVFRDLTEGIVVGFALGAILFIHRMARGDRRRGARPISPRDSADDANGGRTPYDVGLATDPDVVVYRITGAFFFGAASTVGAVLDQISPTSQGVRDRLFRGAVSRFDGRQHDRGHLPQGQAPKFQDLHYRHHSGNPPDPVRAWRQAPGRDLQAHDRRRRCQRARPHSLERRKRKGLERSNRQASVASCGAK